MTDHLLSERVRLRTASVGPMDNNAYLLIPNDGEAVLIDAAAEPDTLLGLLSADAAQPVTLGQIITTHRHGDHWQALSEVADATQAELFCGRGDQDAVAQGAWVENLRGVWDKDTIALGSESLEVIGLVGHTPGSIALAYAPASGPVHLFTGDSLFPGGPGKTNDPDDFASLMDDLTRKIFDRFADDTVVYPGHGRGTTLGAERAELSAWRTRGW